MKKTLWESLHQPPPGSDKKKVDNLIKELADKKEFNKALSWDMKDTKPEECPSYEGRSAPLCPLDPKSLETGIWYPDEEICKSKKVNGLDWIKRQRKLKARAHPEFYFTYRMLNHKFVIRKGIKGLDPNKQEKKELAKWFKAHPEIKERKLTPEHLKALKKSRELKKVLPRKENNEKKYAQNKVFGGVKMKSNGFILPLKMRGLKC